LAIPLNFTRLLADAVVWSSAAVNYTQEEEGRWLRQKTTTLALATAEREPGTDH